MSVERVDWFLRKRRKEAILSGLSNLEIKLESISINQWQIQIAIAVAAFWQWLAYLPRDGLRRLAHSGYLETLEFSTPGQILATLPARTGFSSLDVHFVNPAPVPIVISQTCPTSGAVIGVRVRMGVRQWSQCSLSPGMPTRFQRQSHPREQVRQR